MQVSACPANARIRAHFRHMKRHKRHKDRVCQMTCAGCAIVSACAGLGRRLRQAFRRSRRGLRVVGRCDERRIAGASCVKLKRAA